MYDPFESDILMLLFYGLLCFFNISFINVDKISLNVSLRSHIPSTKYVCSTVIYKMLSKSHKVISSKVIKAILLSDSFELGILRLVFLSLILFFSVRLINVDKISINISFKSHIILTK